MERKERIGLGGVSEDRQMERETKWVRQSVGAPDVGSSWKDDDD